MGAGQGRAHRAARIPPDVGKGGGPRRGRNGRGASAVFELRASLPAEANIPPRPWLVQGYLLRRAVCLPFGPPDQGKTLLLIAWAVALATGRRLGRFRPLSRLRVLLVLAEEDDAEQASRFSAALRAFGATRENVDPCIRRLVVTDLATLLTVDKDTGEVIPAAGWAELRTAVADFAPDVLVLDQLVEFHTADENDNTRLKAVIARFRGLAREFDLAVIISRQPERAP